jgi:hypothetical protein
MSKAVSETKNPSRVILSLPRCRARVVQRYRDSTAFLLTTRGGFLSLRSSSDYIVRALQHARFPRFPVLSASALSQGKHCRRTLHFAFSSPILLLPVADNTSSMSLPISVANREQHAPQSPWVLSSGALTVFYGCPEMPRLSHYFLPRLLFAKKQILYLDGANQISPLLLARFARERRVDPSEVKASFASRAPSPVFN